MVLVVVYLSPSQAVSGFELNTSCRIDKISHCQSCRVWLGPLGCVFAENSTSAMAVWRGVFCY